MSSQGNGRTVQSNSENGSRAVTDSVHSRFRSTHVHCADCNTNIVGNRSAIDRHFNSSHPSKEYCCYCKGKVFHYIQMPGDDSTGPPKRIIYHKCSEYRS